MIINGTEYKAVMAESTQQVKSQWWFLSLGGHAPESVLHRPRTRFLSRPRRWCICVLPLNWSTWISAPETSWPRLWTAARISWPSRPGRHSGNVPRCRAWRPAERCIPSLWLIGNILWGLLLDKTQRPTYKSDVTSLSTYFFDLTVTIGCGWRTSRSPTLSLSVNISFRG